MSTIAAGTTSGTALVSTGNTDGTLQLQVNGTTPSVTLATTGAIGVGSTPGYGTSGQVLTSAGSAAAPTWTTPSAGALTLLATATASDSATVALETGIGSSYDTYFVSFTDVTAGTDNVELQARLKFAGAYENPIYSVGYYSNSDASYVTPLREGTVCTLTRYRVSVYTATGKDASGELWFNRTTNSKYQNLRFQASYWCPNSYGTNIVSDTRGSGLWNFTSACQGIQFRFSSGNIFSGTFRLYGIQNS